MDEFVFPPTMDFVHFPEKVKPFAMYIFEFSHELNQQDLSDIWQNLPPRLGENFEEAEATISHPLFSDHFLSSVQREKGQQTPTGGTIDTDSLDDFLKSSKEQRLIIHQKLCLV